MHSPSAETVRGPWRRRLFWVWIGITVVLAAYLAVAAPLASYVGEGYAAVAVVVPPAMILLAGLGVAWLVALAASKPRRPETGSDAGRTASPEPR